MSRPPTTQSSRIRPACGSARAMSPVVMKMPVPSTEPIVSSAASQAPSPRTRSTPWLTRVLAPLRAGAAPSEAGFYGEAMLDSRPEPTMNDEISIRPAREHADFEACVALQRSVWRLSDLEVTSTIQLIATTHAGGSLLLAFAAQGQPVGFAYAFAALRGGIPHLHSDMLAVLPEHQKRGVGVRLKWAQRDAALAQGVSLITWTFDPLQARNAHLNLRRLGATALEFLPDFYGITTSALHHGLPTDRLLVRWDLNAPLVFERLARPEALAAGAAPEHPRVNEIGR